MNLKILFLCINVVAATSHNRHHLRHQPEQHSIVFQATKGQLRRLLKGQEKKAPSKDLEALHVLRGGSRRFLKGCEKDGQEWDCDKDTEECGNKVDECDEVCDEEDDCNGHGECKDGECECDVGYDSEDDCSVLTIPIVYNFTVNVTAAADTRTPECIEDLNRVSQVHIDDATANLPSTQTVYVGSGSTNRSNRSRNRRLSHSSSGEEIEPLVVDMVIQVNHTCDTAAAAVKALDEFEAAQAILQADVDARLISFECLVDNSEDLLKDVEDSGDANDVEDDLDGLVDTCNVADADASCVTECHDGYKNDCKDEVDPDEEDEDDCEGLHDDLEDCYKECYGL